jgi:hypothetical protein
MSVISLYLLITTPPPSPPPPKPTHVDVRGTYEHGHKSMLVVDYEEQWTLGECQSVSGAV